MKKVISLVCLFFMMSSIPIYAKEDFKDRLNNLLSKEEIEEIEILSKECNELYNDIESEINNLKQINERSEEKIEEYQERLTFYLEQKESIGDIRIYMQLYQLEKETPILDSYQKNYKKIIYYQNKIYEVESKKKSKEETIKTYSQYIVQIENIQNRLWLRFQQNEMKEEGQFNVNSIYAGNELPVYGGYYSSLESDAMACLMAGNYSIDSYSDSWILPIVSGSISAGTWAYPSGELHLGMDFACAMYSNVRAPANGFILYADAPVASDCGYLGNWSGWPAGGGNTICMVCAVNEQLYVVSFAHLSNQIYVVPGQQVNQGDVLALSGNSGNSSGPHCHIEVLRLNQSLEEVVAYFVQNADFSLGNGYSQGGTCSAYACRIRPESVWG